MTSQEVERFFLDYVSQKQIAEGDLPDLEEEEEAGQCCAWLERSVVSLQRDSDLSGVLLSHGSLGTRLTVSGLLWADFGSCRVLLGVLTLFCLSGGAKCLLKRDQGISSSKTQAHIVFSYLVTVHLGSGPEVSPFQDPMHFPSIPLGISVPFSPG